MTLAGRRAARPGGPQSLSVRVLDRLLADVVGRRELTEMLVARAGVVSIAALDVDRAVTHHRSAAMLRPCRGARSALPDRE